MLSERTSQGGVVARACGTARGASCTLTERTAGWRSCRASSGGLDREFARSANEMRCEGHADPSAAANVRLSLGERSGNRSEEDDAIPARVAASSERGEDLSRRERERASQPWRLGQDSPVVARVAQEEDHARHARVTLLEVNLALGGLHVRQVSLRLNHRPEVRASNRRIEGTQVTGDLKPDLGLPLERMMRAA